MCSTTAGHAILSNNGSIPVVDTQSTDHTAVITTTIREAHWCLAMLCFS